MENSDGSIIIDVKLNDSDYESKLSQMEGKTQGFGTQVKSLLTTVGITKAVSAGFNMIKDSVGSAMNRIDTMDQFNRVMTAMTGSTEQANAALDELKGITKGTAYGLDVAAASTQKLVTSGMDIDKATTQIETWGDAVAFYGDGSNESFSNVADAIAKMTSKGTVEMDQLNRLFDAGIPAVEIYASHVGMSTEEVQSSLSSGKISAQEFTDGLTEAMRNGTDSFASIEGAAKEAGASWNATFDNMHAAITRGMTQVLKSIDDALAENGLPTMREMIANVGMVFENVLNFIAEHMPEIISFLQMIAPILTPIIAFLGTFITLYGAMKVATELWTTAQKMLNTVFLDNPILLIISLITALVAAFTYMWTTSEEFRQFWINLWESISSWFIEKWNAIKTFITEAIPKIINDIVRWFQSLPGRIWEWLCNTVSNVMGWGSNLASAAGNSASSAIEAIKNWFINLPSMALQWGQDMIQGFIDGLGNMIGNLGNACAEIANEIFGWLHFSRPEQGPLHFYEEWMPDMMQGLAKGIGSNESLISKAMERVSNLMSDQILDMQLSGTMSDMMNTLFPDTFTVGLEANASDVMDGVQLEQSVKRVNQTSVINQFPKSFSLSGNGMQPIYLILEDGTELAHALVEPLNKELALQ